MDESIKIINKLLFQCAVKRFDMREKQKLIKKELVLSPERYETYSVW